MNDTTAVHRTGHDTAQENSYNTTKGERKG